MRFFAQPNLQASPSNDDYHNDRLVLKMAPASREEAESIVGGLRSAASDVRERHPGIAMLRQLETAGMIRRITPLQPSDAASQTPRGEFGGMRGMTAMTVARAASTAGGNSNSPTARLQIVQTQPGADLNRIRAALVQDPSVESVELVPRRWLSAKRKRSPTKSSTTASATAAPPMTMWNLQKIRWPQAHAAGHTQADSISVAVLDTGVDLRHPNLDAKRTSLTYDFGVFGSPVSDLDIVGHGTHVGGTIAAKFDNADGINGLTDAAIHHYKIFDDAVDRHSMDRGWEVYQFFVEPESYHLALTECLSGDHAVVNLSIGGYGLPSLAERTLFAELSDAGVTVVAAMGNDASSRPSYPAAIDSVIAVGATRPDDRVADFSNRGKHIAVVAPGTGIWSTLPTYSGYSIEYRHPGTGQIDRPQRSTLYDAWDGTSMACPHVVAAAAMLLHHQRSLTPGDIRELLSKHSDRTSEMGRATFSDQYGYGRLNLERLMAAL